MRIKPLGDFKKYIHGLFKPKLVWTMTIESNLIIFALSVSFFSVLLNKYPEFFNNISSGFLIGMSIGLAFGLYWRHIMARNWNFYKKFYSVKTKDKKRMKMISKKLGFELPTYAGSVALGLVLLYLILYGYGWLAGSVFFGFVSGGSLAVVIILKELL